MVRKICGLAALLLATGVNAVAEDNTVEQIQKIVYMERNSSSNVVYMEKESPWFGYFGVGPETELVRYNTRRGDKDISAKGEGKIVWNIGEVFLGNRNHPNWTFFGKLQHVTQTDGYGKSNESTGYLVELWPRYTKRFDNLTLSLAGTYKGENMSGNNKTDYDARGSWGYSALGISPELFYSITPKTTLFLRTLYREDITNKLDYRKEKFLESEIGLSYQLTDNVRAGIGYFYKDWDDMPLYDGAKFIERNYDKKEEIFKAYLSINFPEYDLNITPIVEFGGYSDVMHRAHTGGDLAWDENYGFVDKLDETGSYKFILAAHKKITESFSIFGEVSYKFLNTDIDKKIYHADRVEILPNGDYDRDVWFCKLLLKYTF